MRLLSNSLSNSGNQRVIDLLRSGLQPSGHLDIATPGFSLFAFAELTALLAGLTQVRLVLPPYTLARQCFDRLKRLCHRRELPDAAACARFDRATKEGEDMRQAQRLLGAAVASIVGKSEERAVASLFSPGGTHALKGEFAGSDDFEVMAFLVILPGDTK